MFAPSSVPRGRSRKVKLKYGVLRTKQTERAEFIVVWLRIYSGSGKFCKRCQTSPPHGETQEHLLLCSDLASRRNADNITLEISRIISADLSIDNDIHDAIILRVNDSISSRPVKTDEKVQALLDEINSRPKHPQHPNRVRVDFLSCRST